jgi:hypothetical protein
VPENLPSQTACRREGPGSAFLVALPLAVTRLVPCGVVTVISRDRGPLPTPALRPSSTASLSTVKLAALRAPNFTPSLQ